MPTDQVQQHDLTNLELQVKIDVRAEMREKIDRLRREIDQLQWILVIAIGVVLLAAAIFLPPFFRVLSDVKMLVEAAAP